MIMLCTQIMRIMTILLMTMMNLVMLTWGTGNTLANWREGGNTTPGKCDHDEGQDIYNDENDGHGLEDMSKPAVDTKLNPWIFNDEDFYNDDLILLMRLTMAIYLIELAVDVEPQLWTL